METWDIQRYHLETHNLFYSALFGERDTGLVDLGYHVVGEFSELEDPRSETVVQPCYTIFDGSSVVFFDLLEPGTITDEAVDRVASYNEVGREAVENHIDNLDLSDPALDHSDVDTFDHCVVCRSEQLSRQRSGSSDDRRRLSRLEHESDIACIEEGNSLSMADAGGSLRVDNVNDLLENGISIPADAPHSVYLPRNIQNECLAIAICEEVVFGSDLRNGGIELQHQDIRNHFGRSISFDRLDDVFDFLYNIGGCRRSNGGYRFTEYTLPQALDARSKFENRTMAEYLSEDDDMTAQISLEEYEDYEE
jgi:hypothetical protein